MMKSESESYKAAGVDITAGYASVELMKKHVARTMTAGCVEGIGGFGGLFALDAAGMEEPVLVSGTDGVGTKLKIAMLLDKHDTIGIDAVAMCVNDILVQGAEPLFFLDYIAVGKLDPDRVAAIVKGVAEGCKQSNCSLIGGETAEMPGFYPDEDYDIAGFAVGVADKSKILTGDKVVAGDVLIGLPSTGLHSNGFSLARRVLLPNDVAAEEYDDILGQTIGEAMLTPTRIYVKDILPLLDSVDIHGMCHITGGGLLENLPRVYNEGLCAEIDSITWERPPIFDLIQQRGDIPDAEMYRVFNMGIGYVIIVPECEADKVLAACPDGCVIGHMAARGANAPGVYIR